MANISFLSGSIYSTAFFGITVYIFFVVIRYLIKFQRMRHFFDALPGYSTKQKHWIRGNLHLYVKNDSVDVNQINTLTRRFPKFYRVWFGPFTPVVSLVHPDSVKVLLKTAEPKPVGHGPTYRTLIPWLGEGLLIAGGSKWARSRRLLTPAFHFEILKGYQTINNQCVDILINILEKYADTGESFDLFQLISNCTLDIILQSAFSYKTNCQHDRLQHSYCKAITEVTKLASRRNRNPLMMFDIIYNMTSDGKLFKQNCDYIHSVADSVIDSRKKILDNGQKDVKKYLDFLDILLSAKDENGIGMSKTDIRAEVDTFMFEGHDTTTSAISWILYDLAKHPEYQKMCQNEVDKALENNPGFVKWEDLGKFEFLTQCIKEGMRLHSPVPLISRQSTKEFTLEGITFPPGTFFGINIYGLHHNPAVWTDPTKFDPDRFSKDNATKMDSFAFTPFSAGPRNCIGQHFAMNEEKTLITRILKRFTLEPDPDHTVSPHMAAVMRSRNGIKCIAKRRKEQ
ncbi:leukotriene-B4 omega-hydroxylase 3-like [Mytilus galloprovincialis]|uniref:leukotriene-B4 omega-hydroxylase 3-like n=1 Tax=Mytilus galloprovincialis TaxID=29158 RepID=UPI003F7C2AF8